MRLIHCDCPPNAALGIVRSNEITISQCTHCGAFWLTEPGGEPHPAVGDALVICELLACLVRARGRIGRLSDRGCEVGA